MKLDLGSDASEAHRMEIQELEDVISEMKGVINSVQLKLKEEKTARLERTTNQYNSRLQAVKQELVEERQEQQNWKTGEARLWIYARPEMRDFICESIRGYPFATRFSCRGAQSRPISRR